MGGSGSPVKSSAFLALLLSVAATPACQRRPEEPVSSAPPAVTAGAPTAAAPSAGVTDVQKLVGRWMRSDWDYMIWIKSAAPDGTLEASYLNPNPIQVSRAESRHVEGRLKVLVQMSDRNYPGSYYTLTYDPGSDTLWGIYHQLVQNQQFEVVFHRLADGKTESPGQR
ncbi:MAG: hypothetical protein ACRD3M_13950 [Thermoanaerobaculia bacterium]